MRSAPFVGHLSECYSPYLSLLSLCSPLIPSDKLFDDIQVVDFNGLNFSPADVGIDKYSAVTLRIVRTR